MVMQKEHFHYMQILFSKTIEECRQLGARGGRAHARNLRLRQSQAPVQPLVQLPELPSESAHEASLRLDVQFPWLAGSFLRRQAQPNH
jgi:hypothetical protein